MKTKIKVQKKWCLFFNFFNLGQRAIILIPPPHAPPCILSKTRGLIYIYIYSTPPW